MNNYTTFEECYSLIPGGPKNLVISWQFAGVSSWEGEIKDMIIKLDETIIDKIPKHEDIIKGKEIVLPDGRILCIKLKSVKGDSLKIALSVFLNSHELNFDGSMIKPTKLNIEKNALSDAENDLLDTLSEDKFFDTACNAYIEGKYDFARKLFQRQVDISPQTDESKISQAQLFFLKKNPPTTNYTAIIWGSAIVQFIFKKNTNGVIYADNIILLCLFVVSIQSIYWIYYSFRWPCVFRVMQTHRSAIAWLIYVGLSTLIVAILELTHVININDMYIQNSPISSNNQALLMLIIGFIILLAAYFAIKAPPLWCMLILFIVTIIWTYDTGNVLSVVFLSFVTSSVKIEIPMYASALLHMIALNSITKGIGACRGLRVLSAVSQRSSPDEA